MNKNKYENTLQDFYLRKNNSFDFIRFVLTTLVIYSHSKILLYGIEGDILASFTANQINFGQLAVFGFFVLSGFLITQSLEASNSYIDYYLKRFLRIFPAFLCSLLLIAFILGPFLSELSMRDYFFTSSNNSPYSFIFNNITFNIFSYSWTVNDLFSANSFPSSANGSMWTLKHEFAMYLILPILSYFLFLKQRKFMLVSLVITITLSFLNIKSNYMFLHLPGETFWVFGVNEYSQFIKLASYFLAGSIMYLYKDKILINKRFLLLAILFVLVGGALGKLQYVLLLTLPYIIICIGVGFKYPRFSKYGDFSYGLYIYAFPVQQTISYLFGDNLNVFSFFVSSFIITLIISILSWIYIERPALNLKRKLKIE